MPTTGTLCFPDAGTALPAGAATKKLASFPADPLPQLPKQNWCWAAVCQAVLRCFGIQCSLQQVVAMCTPEKDHLDEPHHVVLALQALDLAMIERVFDPIDVFVSDNCANNPVPITIEWAGTSKGHAICALGTGTLNGEPAILIYDPIAPCATVTGRDLIKLVTVAALGGSYLEQHKRQVRGRWTQAVRVTGHAP